MATWEGFSRAVEVGSGAPVAQAVTAALFSWELHRRAGLEVTGDPVRMGARAELRWRFGPVRIPAPVQVIEVLGEPDRIGFTYRALPGHPEEGEETFLVEVDAQGRVWFRVSARSRPATWWARAGATVARRVQRHITSACLSAASDLGTEADKDVADSG